MFDELDLLITKRASKPNAVLHVGMHMLHKPIDQVVILQASHRERIS